MFGIFPKSPKEKLNGNGRGGGGWSPRLGGGALYIMLIAHLPQLPFGTNYRKANCEINFFFGLRWLSV